MRRPVLYVETSVFGFYYDKRKENISKREASIKLFDQIYKGLFDAYYSNVTLAEIEKTKDPNKRRKLLSLISRYGIERLTEPENIEDVELLTTTLIEKKIIPANKKDDAFHLALAILSPQIDYLITWNYKHLANKNTFRQVKVVALSQRYEVKFEVATPEEMIYYE